MYRSHASQLERLIATVARNAAIGMVGVLCVVRASAAPGDFPHWDEQACSACHGEGTPTTIKSYDDDVMCGKCHEKPDTTSCRHPSGRIIGNSIALPDTYRSAVREGKLVCTTCHDPLVQCQGDKLAPYLNPRFLRDGPFQQRDEACFLCHDRAAYPKLNPHSQLSGTDKRLDVCVFCHEGSAERVSASSGYQMDPSKQCLGCHPVSPHPMAMIPGRGVDSWNHLVVPSESTTRQMNGTRERTGARLPLDPGTGKVTCATCHDPHETGVIPGDPPHLDRARLRPVARCENCHEK